MATTIEWTDQTKGCSHCGDVKPLSDFARDRTRPDRLTCWCRSEPTGIRSDEGEVPA